MWARSGDFWYSKPVQGGRAWIHVDALHGVRELLFDHRRLAAEVNAKLETSFAADALPFTDPAFRFTVKYDGSNSFTQEGALAVEFAFDGAVWRCELQGEWDWARTPPSDYYCDKRGEGAAPSPVPETRRSPDGRWVAAIEKWNIVVRPTLSSGPGAITLTTDGVEGNAYHAGSIEWRPDGSGLRAYKVNDEVWKSDATTGSVKHLIVAKDLSLPK